MADADEEFLHRMMVLAFGMAGASLATVIQLIGPASERKPWGEAGITTLCVAIPVMTMCGIAFYGATRNTHLKGIRERVITFVFVLAFLAVICGHSLVLGSFSSNAGAAFFSCSFGALFGLRRLLRDRKD